MQIGIADAVLLRQRVRQDHDLATVEEVENSTLQAPVSNAQLVDAASKVRGDRTP
jgi:hypothetical protein